MNPTHREESEKEKNKEQEKTKFKESQIEGKNKNKYIVTKNQFENLFFGMNKVLQ